MYSVLFLLDRNILLYIFSILLNETNFALSHFKIPSHIKYDTVQLGYSTQWHHYSDRSDYVQTQ